MKTFHVYPVGDKKEHRTDEVYCECNPWIEYFGAGRIVIHNSFDGRERFETAQNELLEMKRHTS